MLTILDSFAMFGQGDSQSSCYGSAAAPFTPFFLDTSQL